jgi:hypothetical protein
MMKFLAMTIAALSLAAVTTASATIDPHQADAVKSFATAAVSAKPADVTFVGRRGRKCQENLGYGRTSGFGCG